jgi:hypothetical protein
VNALLGGKGERTGVFRPELRQLRDVLIGCPQRRHQPRVIARLAPAGECQAGRRPQRLAHIGKRKRRLGKKHHAEPRDQQIRARGVERIHGCVGEHEIDRQASRRDLPGPRQHQGRDVDPEDVSGWTDFSRQCDCRRPTTATYIDDPRANFGLGAVDQKVGDRRKQNVLGLLAVGPVLAARPIPVCDLVGIQIVARRCFHALTLQYLSKSFFDVVFRRSR